MTASIFFVKFHMKLQKKWGHSFSYHFLAQDGYYLLL